MAGKHQIMAVYNEMKGEMPAQDSILARLQRGRDILLDWGYDVREAGNVWHVEKASTSPVITTPTCYVVTKDSCSCPDYDTAVGGLCKHRFAVKILERVQHESR